MSHDLALLIFEPEGNLPMRKYVLRTPYQRLSLLSGPVCGDSKQVKKHGQPTRSVTTTASLRLDRGQA
jgi:hypothetical protein